MGSKMEAAARKLECEGGDDLLASDIMLPTQFWVQGADGRFEPEKRLMIAVLEEALATLLRPGASQTRSSRQVAVEAIRWIRSDDRSSPFSFATICDVLGLDADRVREVIALRQEHRRPFPRRRVQAGRGRHRVRYSTRRERNVA
jgi:hypothetical protein